jgi:hypothetical protein
LTTSLLSKSATQVLDWKMFGVWLDTEGSLSSVITRMRKGDRVGQRRDYELAVYQNERDVMEFLRDFLVKSGISNPYLYQDQRTGVWALKVYRIKDIERIIQEVEPYILTLKKRLQVEKFRRLRSEKYKKFLEVTN